MYDAELYRTKDEVREWMHSDPIALLEERMRAGGLLADADLQSIEADIACELDQAIAEAEAGPWEPLEDLTQNVYAPGQT
jgi:pyruvate dehydrogenase E1 component alpha subunit